MPVYLTSLIRTVTPLIVGWLISLPVVPWLLSAMDIDTQRATEVVSALLTIVLSAVYYAAVRFLETHKAQFGWLLGKAAQVVYAPTTAAVIPGAGGAAVIVPEYDPKHDED